MALCLQVGELLQELALPGREVSRCSYLHGHEQVTFRLVSKPGHALAVKPEGGVALDSGRDGHLDSIPAQTGDDHLRAEGGIREGDWSDGEEIIAMKDSEGVQFLQWCLPKLGLRWQGFRKVRRQVYTRINRRLKGLGLSDISGYRSYLENRSAEWAQLDALCWISISRFYRDKGVFQYLEREVLPGLARMAVANRVADLRCWSIGCAAGEEPYTLTILWELVVGPQFPALRFSILATDADPQAIARAYTSCYPSSCLKDLPREWVEKAFLLSAQGLCLRERYREPVTFREEDIRVVAPSERLHLILCRNLAFTYFDEELQRVALDRIKGTLLPGGGLVIGATESLPGERLGFEPWSRKFGVHRRCSEVHRHSPPNTGRRSILG